MTRHRRRIVCNTPRWNQIEQVGGARGGVGMTKLAYQAIVR